MHVQEIIDKITELRTAGNTNGEILIDIQALYPRFPDFKTRFLLGVIQ